MAGPSRFCRRPSASRHRAYAPALRHGPGGTRTHVGRIMSGGFAGLLALESRSHVALDGVVEPLIGRVGNTWGTRGRVGISAGSARPYRRLRVSTARAR